MILNILVLANSVPAAAVIREGQVLFKLIGRKELLGCKSMKKFFLLIKVYFT